MLLAGKVAVITGGGRGNRPRHRTEIAGEGAAAVVAARTELEIEAVAKEIRDAGGRAAAVPADVAQEEQCRHLIGVAESQFGRVDILVNNAGEYGPVKPVEEITPPEWDRVIAVHLRGAYLLTHLVLPGMYARASGVILNISSLSAKSAFGWGSPYAAAKAGMLGLTRVAARKAPVRRAGERDMPRSGNGNQNVKGSREPSQTHGHDAREALAGFLDTVLQGRGQTTDEIAAAALFLCSDQAKRDYWAVSERGRRNCFLLRSSAKVNPTARQLHCGAARSPAQPILHWPARSTR